MNLLTLNSDFGIRVKRKTNKKISRKESKGSVLLPATQAESGKERTAHVMEEERETDKERKK